jgi:hypothetical protein
VSDRNVTFFVPRITSKFNEFGKNRLFIDVILQISGAQVPYQAISALVAPLREQGVEVKHQQVVMCVAIGDCHPLPHVDEWFDECHLDQKHIAVWIAFASPLDQLDWTSQHFRVV